MASDNRTIGSVSIKVTPDAKHFRRDTQRQIGERPLEVEMDVKVDEKTLDDGLNDAQRKLKKKKLEISYDIEQKSLNDAMRKIDRAMKAMDLEHMKVNLDKDSLNRARAELEALSNDPNATIRIDTHLDESGFRKVREQLEEIQRQDLETTFEVNADQSSIAEALAEVKAFERAAQIDDIKAEIDFDSTSSLQAAMSRLQAMLASLPPVNQDVNVRLNRASLVATMAQINAGLARNFQAQVAVEGTGFAALEAKLQAISRTRVIKMRTELTGRVARLLEGGFRSLAGINDIEEMVKAFENLIINFDVISTQAAVMGSAIGTAVNVGTHALGGLLVTLADASKVVGLLAAAPTALLASAAVLQTHNAIWGGFREALMGIPGALEELPPNAQRAVKSIEALNEATNQAVQDGFWGVMNDEISRFADEVAPTLTRGMEGTAQVYGNTMKQMLDRTIEFTRSGQLGAGFSNINAGLSSIGDAAATVYDGLMTMGLAGSRMMPRLGHEVNNLAIRFNEWVQAAAESGKIETWIMQGVRAMQLMTQAGAALGGIMRGLTGAFRNAGIGGLQEFVNGLQRASELMNSPVWQMKMGNIFAGAIDGARDFYVGLQRLGQVALESDEAIARLLRTIGEVSREFQFRLADVFTSPAFGPGIQAFFDGLRDSLLQLQPAAQSLGDIIGTLGSIAGEVLREMAPGVNTLLGIFSDAANGLRDTLVAAVHPLTTFIDNLGHMARLVTNLLVPPINAVLTAFNALPAPVQNFISLVVAASGHMIALRAVLSGMAATAVGGALARQFAGLGGHIANVTRQATVATAAIANMGRAATFGALQTAGVGAFGAIGTAARTAAAGARTQFAGAMSGIARSARGIGGIFMGMVGGPVGIAIMAAVTGIGMIVSKFAEAKQEAEEVNAAARELADIVANGGDKADIQAGLFEKMRDTLKEIEAVGGSVDGIIQQIANGQNVQGLINDWELAADAVKGYELAMEQGYNFGGLTQEQSAAIQRLGLDWDNLKGKGSGALESIAEGLAKGQDIGAGMLAEIQLMESAMSNMGDAAVTSGSQARQAFEGMEGALAVSDEARQFADAIRAIGDSAAGADSQISAFMTALQLMGSAGSSNVDSAVESWNRMDAAMQTAARSAEAGGNAYEGSTNKIASSVEHMSERSALAHQGIAELQEAMVARAIDAYNREMNASNDKNKAIEAGKAAYADNEAAIASFADKAGLSVDSVRDAFDNLATEADIEATLQLTNLSEHEISAAYEGLTKIKEAGVDIDESSWMAFIAANPDQAFLALSNTQLALANYEANEYLASLSADDQDAVRAIAHAEGMGSEWASGDYAAILRAISEMGDAEAAWERLKEWDSEKAEAIFGADNAEAIEKIQAIIDGTGEIPYEKSVELGENGGADLVSTLENLNTLLEAIAKEWGIDLSVSGLEEVTSGLTNVTDKADTWAGSMFQAAIDAIDDATPKVDEAGNKIDTFGGKEGRGKLDADDNASPKASNALTNLGMIDSTWWARMFGQDEVSPKAGNAKSAVDGIPGSKTSNLNANDSLGGLAAAAMRAVLGIPSSRTSNLNGNDSLSGTAGRAAGAVTSIPASWIARMIGQDSTSGPASGARSAIQNIPRSWLSRMMGSDGTSGLANGARNAVRNIPQSWLSRLMGTDGTTAPARNALGSIRAVPQQWLSALIGNDNTSGPARNAMSAVQAIPRTWQSVITAIDRATGVVNSIKGAIASVTGKTVSIITNYISRKKSANGNLFGSVDGSGGLQSVEAFAQGGMRIKENHRAQIAKPSTVHRVWAEPETGGEAYIPLAASKRARSVNIWKETGRRLGVFADGGVVGGEEVASRASAVFNINNHYPVAEKTSETVMRSAALIGVDPFNR